MLAGNYPLIVTPEASDPIPMNIVYLLLLLGVVIIDILLFTEIAQLLRAPSDASVAMGAGFFVLLAVVNYFLIRFLLSKIKNQ
jgi:hypothetical protein